MNKKIITFAIAALGLCSISASAQDADKHACNQPNCEQRADNKMYKPQKFTDIAFEGILLDMNQQAAIDKIDEQYKGQLCPRGPRVRQCDSIQCKGVKCDKKAACNRGDNRAKCTDGKSWRREYAKQVKEVLTPDQYVMFLENIAFSTPQPQGVGRGHHHKKFDKCDCNRRHSNPDCKCGQGQCGQQELKAQGMQQHSK